MALILFLSSLKPEPIINATFIEPHHQYLIEYTRTAAKIEE